METFKVVLEIEVDAKDSLDAAKIVEKAIQDEGGLTYYVQDESNKIYSVDLSEDDSESVLDANDYQPMIKN